MTQRITLIREFEDKNYFKLVCYDKNRIQPIESIFFTFSKIFINVQSLTIFKKWRYTQHYIFMKYH